MKKVPIGISDFETIIDDGYYYVDKTLFIKEILDKGAAVTLIPRPRRFGKTLNMSMLKCFFENNQQSKQHLFTNLNISKYSDCMTHYGQYPVIFMTFKDAKMSNWVDCYEKITYCISNEFARHAYLLKSDVLTEIKKKFFSAILDGTATSASYSSALQELCSSLALFHKKKVVILIDEYDSPIHAGFINNFYKEVIDFMRSFLGEGLKDNVNLKFAVMTGILRVAKESIFSGLNNLDVCSLLSNKYADQFGLTEAEVIDFLTDFTLLDNLLGVKTWYNGYSVGSNHVTVYNPWSLINFVDTGGIFQPYWVNTSDNAIIQELLMHSSGNVKKEIEHLLRGEVIEKTLSDNITFSLLYAHEDVLWSFLFFCGYVSYDKIYLKEGAYIGLLRLPNKEVNVFYQSTIVAWLKNSLQIDAYHYMLQALVAGNIEEFKTIFYDMILDSLSTFDIGGKEPERFYHALVLGMLVSLRDRYEVSSNRESGYGRYDVAIIPKNPQQDPVGIIIEFKKKTSANPTLEKAAQVALDQIEAQAYEVRLRNAGVQKIIKLAIAFDGKQALVLEG